MKPVSIRTAGPALLAASVGLVAADLAYRSWHLRWGATLDELAAELPGDDVICNPSFSATRAVTVDAPPDCVWPWITQMGFGRAGWYSYDLLDNLGRSSAETIIAGLQDIHRDSLVPIGPGGFGLKVMDLEPGHWVLWWDGHGYTTWLWNLRGAGRRTRLVTRVRLRYRWAHSSILFDLLLVEPFDFPMMRKCMLGIKRRAEAMASNALTSNSLYSGSAAREAGGERERSGNGVISIA